MVFEDYNFSSIALQDLPKALPQGARDAIPSWPFAAAGPDNPIENVLAMFYRRWQLLKMVEAEERAGAFTYRSLMLLRPDACCCGCEEVNLDTLFPAEGYPPQLKGAPLRTFEAAAATGTPLAVQAQAAREPPGRAHVLLTPAVFGQKYHYNFLNQMVNDQVAAGGREEVGWYLSAFPFSEVLSGQRHGRYHPETLTMGSLRFGLESKALQTKVTQSLDIYDTPLLKACLKRVLGGECDWQCSLVYEDEAATPAQPQPVSYNNPGGQPFVSGPHHGGPRGGGNRVADILLAALDFALRPPPGCPAGTYNSSTSALIRQCTPCSVGTYSFGSRRGASTPCMPCPSGFTSAEGMSSCEPAGSPSSILPCPTGFSSCTQSDSPDLVGSCPAGSFAASTTPLVCPLCIAGTYSFASKPGERSVCSPCPSQYFSAHVGSSTCEPIP